MLTLMGPVAVLALAALFAWAGARSWHIRHRLLRLSAVVCSALLCLACGSAGVLGTVGLFKLHARRALVPEVRVAGTPEQIRRGGMIAASFCGGCHERNDALIGGYDLGNYLSVPLGRFITSNLTPAGELGRWSDGEIFRAIRNSIGRDGDWLIIMSLTSSGNLSDEDIQSLIAYLRQLPTAGRATPHAPDRLNPLGLMMLGAGVLDGKPVLSGVLTAPPRGPNSRYGEYLLSYQDCRGCHGATLAGSVPGGRAALGPALDRVRSWKREEFIATMRTGVDPQGHELTSAMPWRPLGMMDDEALSAIYEYLAHLPLAQSVARN